VGPTIESQPRLLLLGTVALDAPVDEQRTDLVLEEGLRRTRVDVGRTGLLRRVRLRPEGGTETETDRDDDRDELCPATAPEP